MMACVLEYIDNGSLGDWLRSDSQKRKPFHGDVLCDDASDTSRVRRKRHEQASKLPLDQALFEGWKPPPNSNYLLEDKILIEVAEQKIMYTYKSCQSLSDGWRESEPISSYKDSLLGFSEKQWEAGKFKSWVKLADTDKAIWEAVCSFEVDMRPDQWMAGEYLIAVFCFLKGLLLVLLLWFLFPFNLYYLLILTPPYPKQLYSLIFLSQKAKCIKIIWKNQKTFFG